MLSVACLTGCGGGPDQSPNPNPLGGQGSSSNPPDSKAPAGSDAGSSTEPAATRPCTDIYGAIHGQTTCVKISRADGAVSPSPTRLLYPATAANCGDTFEFGTATVKVACTETITSTTTKHVGVEAFFVDDKAHPALVGQHIPLDAHDGYWDSIIIWAQATDATIDVTIDYTVLE